MLLVLQNEWEPAWKMRGAGPCTQPNRVATLKGKVCRYDEAGLQNTSAKHACKTRMRGKPCVIVWERAARLGAGALIVNREVDHANRLQDFGGRCRNCICRGGTAARGRSSASTGQTPAG